MSVTGEDSYTVSYAYDANNRLTAQNKTIGTSVETTNYSYDPNGNLIAELNSVTAPQTDAESTLGIGIVGVDNTGAKLYEYDSRNRLVKAIGDLGTAEYGYNADGLRKSKTVNGTTTGYIWNGMNMIAETSGGVISANYAYDVTGIAMSRQSGAYQYYLKNAHGDVTGLVNESGTLIQSYVYDAFGNWLNTDDTDTNPFRYADEYYDTETDSVYYCDKIGL